MTKQDEQLFRKIVKEETLGVLKSSGGQEAIIGAMNSNGGQEAIKKGALAAIESEEGHDILIDSFVEGFHEVVVPVFEDHHERIKKIERKVGMSIS